MTSSLRWLTLAAGFGTISLLALQSSVVAQDKKDDKSEPIKFRTVDGVVLKGNWYDGGQGKKSPVVIFLHQLGKNRTQGDWDALARRLQSKGYSVLSFDFRGHGESKDIDDAQKFLSFPFNQKYGRFGNNPSILKTIDQKQFNPGYWVYLLNDIAAARRYVDARNDEGACNSSQLYFVGAQEGATLGFLWTIWEWSRLSVNPIGGLAVPPKIFGGEDIAGAIWLTASSRLRGIALPRIPDKTKLVVAGEQIERDVRRRLTENTQMFFIYSKEDPSGAADANYFMRIFYPSAPPKNKDQRTKYAQAIEKGNKLQGADLLGKSLDVEGTIEIILKEMRNRAEGGEWKPRNPTVVEPMPVPLEYIGWATK